MNDAHPIVTRDWGISNDAMRWAPPPVPVDEQQTAPPLPTPPPRRPWHHLTNTAANHSKGNQP